MKWEYYANYSTRDDTSRCNWHHWMGWVRAAKSRTAPAKAGRETGTTCERLLLKADHNLGLAGRNLKINATLAVGSEGRVEVDWTLESCAASRFAPLAASQP